jgi:hypothetical protein
MSRGRVTAGAFYASEPRQVAQCTYDRAAAFAWIRSRLDARTGHKGAKTWFGSLWRVLRGGVALRCEEDGQTVIEVAVLARDERDSRP